MKRIITLTLLLLTGCSSIKEALDSEISPTGAYYDHHPYKSEPYVDKRTPEQIEADREAARKYLEEQDELWKKSHFANPVNAPKK